MKRLIPVIYLVIVFLVAMVSTASASVSTGSSSNEMNLRYTDIYGKLPLSFVENRGQLNNAVRYVINGPAASAFFTNTGVTFDLVKMSGLKVKSNNIYPISQDSYRPEKHAVLKMEFAGASPKCRAVGVEKLPGKVNILKGSDSSQWKTDIPAYRGIIYKDAWKGIDVSYSGNRKQIKYDIIVNPGANVSDIKLRYKGADKIWLDKKGDLHIKTAVASFTETVPGIYQIKSGKQTSLKGGYILLDKQTVGFKVHGADPRLPIVIDPASDLVYSVFIGRVEKLGGGCSIEVDSSGYVYMSGTTSSPDFPTTSGAYDTISDVNGDRFVIKLNPSCNTLVYSTFIGGSSGDGWGDMALDPYGSVYLTGGTNSIDFPVTSGAYDCSYNNRGDAFVTKLSQDGDDLEYSTYLGGTGYEYGLCIAVDSYGCAYVAGTNYYAGFPITAGAFDSIQASNTGYPDIFVTKLNSTGSDLDYSTYLGKSGSEYVCGIAVDIYGCAYLTGYTYAIDYPTTPGAFDTSFDNDKASFITKLNASGSALEYSTLLEGNRDDQGNDIAVDLYGCAYVTGYTHSFNFPTTPGAFDTSKNLDSDPIVSSSDAFISKINPTGSSLIYSTYLGGNSSDYGNGIKVDSYGNAYVIGGTSSTTFPTTFRAFDASFNLASDIFIVKLNPAGSELRYSTYLGGSGNDSGTDITIDSSGIAYISAETNSKNFPTTPGPFTRTASEDNTDVYIVRFNLNQIYTPDLLIKGGNTSYDYNDIYSEDGSNQIKSQDTSAGQTVSYGFKVQNDGNTDDSYTITGTGGGDGWTVKYFDIIMNNDVTAKVIGSGWTSGSLKPGATNGIYALVTPDSTVSPGTIKTLIITTASQSDKSRKDVGKAITTAVSICHPDLLIKSGNSSYDGNNIYSTDGSNQMKTQNTVLNQTVNYGFRVQNDGDASDTFTITGPAGGNGWTVRYYDLTSNADVTSQVTGSGWSSGILAPGATNGVYAKITPDSTVTPGSVNTLLITAAYQSDPAKIDVCKAVTTAVPTFKTDILIKSGAETSYSFNNIYSTDGSNQTKTINASTNQKVSYGFRVQNDGNAADTFKITGPAGGSGWTVVYKDLTTNADVTSQVTGSGWSSGSLAPGATNGVYVSITPDGTVPADSEKILTITAISQSDTSRIDVCKAVTRKQ